MQPKGVALERTVDVNSLGAGWSPLRHAVMAFLLVYGVVVAGTLGLNAHSVFVRPVIEQGDIAANALAIRDAKAFTRITGNYSRFGFDHPGPFFLYVYAAGEYVFYDALGLVPSPHNAHVLAGVLLQAGFFALAVALISFWVRSTLFPPVALLLCTIYFAALNGPAVPEQLRGSLFISIWPPHWVMFPTLCFLAASASLAAGQVLALPIAAFCGAVIVHGYINTPIYIAPIFAGCYLAYLAVRKFSAGEPLEISVWRQLRLHVITLAILAAFIAPIVLDMTRGASSNFARILATLDKYEGARHPLGEVIPYVINYFTFLSHGAMYLQETGGSPWKYLATQWPSLCGWFLLPFVVLSATVYQYKRIGRVAAIHVFAALAVAVLWLGIAVYGAIGTIGWLYFYICYHLFAVPILLLLLLSATLVRLMPIQNRVGPYLPFILLLAVLLLPLVPSFRASLSGYDWRLDRREQLGPVKELPATIEAALGASPAAPSTVVLDLVSLNAEGAAIDTSLPAVHVGPSIGILLERRGIPFVVNTTRVALFGDSRALTPETDLASLGNFVVWRILPAVDAGTEAIPVGADLALVVVKDRTITGR